MSTSYLWRHGGCLHSCKEKIEFMFDYSNIRINTTQFHKTITIKYDIEHYKAACIKHDVVTAKKFTTKRISV